MNKKICTIIFSFCLILVVCATSYASDFWPKNDKGGKNKKHSLVFAIAEDELVCCNSNFSAGKIFAKFFAMRVNQVYPKR